MFSNTPSSWDINTMVAVHATEDIEYLIKEGEIVTGRRGHKFIIASADRLVYPIQCHRAGFRIQRLDHEDNPTSSMTLLAGEFHLHRVGEALRAGQVFTLPVNL